MAVVFFSYSHHDEGLRDRLETSLVMLKRQGLIETFHDRRIPPGDVVDEAIDTGLERADLILLLVSPDFLASAYCYSREMGCALERAESGAAKVVPIILRPCDWQHSKVSRFKALPTDAKPVTRFTDLDEAFLDISNGIRQSLTARDATGTSRQSSSSALRAGIVAHPTGALASHSGPRSSNLRLKKSFTDIDRDRFRDEAFEFIATFFENSIEELKARNPGVEGMFKRIDGHQFTAQLYRNGKKRSTCRVFLSSGYSDRGIAYSSQEGISDGFNESLGVEAGNDGLFLKAIGMASYGQEKRHFTFEGGAELYWSMFIEALQPNR